MNSPETQNPTGMPTPLASYSHLTTWNDLVFVAGQLALDEDTRQPMAHLDAAQQTRTVLTYLVRALDAAGSGIDRVLKTTVYVASLDDYQAVNAVYAEFFDNHRPARATVEVSGLVGGLVVEVDAIAVRDSVD